MEQHHESSISVTQINQTSVNIKIGEIKSLLTEQINPIYRYQLEIELKNYLAIKNLLDSAKKK